MQILKDLAQKKCPPKKEDATTLIKDGKMHHSIISLEKFFPSNSPFCGLVTIIRFFFLYNKNVIFPKLSRFGKWHLSFSPTFQIWKVAPQFFQLSKMCKPWKGKVT